MELPEGMNIHLVFHKSLLEKAPPDAKLGLVLIYKETQEPMYNVEEILDYNIERFLEPRYLVKWLGYEDLENT